jgi:hypothetical protein
MARIAVLAALVAGTAALVPTVAEADDEPTPYTCTVFDGNVPPGELLSFDADLLVTAPTAPATAKVFQPLTWTFDIDEPDLAPPLSVNLNYLRVRIAVPANLTNVTARAVAAAGEMLNPSADLISVTATGGEVVVSLPNPPATTNRWIRAGSDGSLTYPSTFSAFGNPVVLPRIQVTGVPTPGAGGTDVVWRAPTIESATVIGPDPVTVDCTADGDTPPVITSTAVSTTRQTCDGKPVTVQLGYNAPTAGPNVIQGRAAADSTNGLGGADRFCGLGGADAFHGGPGNDRAVGGLGNDRLFGDAGDDRLQGDGGTDTLNGGAGRDSLIGGTQRDTCIGGTQRDTAATCEVRRTIP